MRKKLKMRAGGKVAKYAEGGRVSQGLRSPRASQARVQEAERTMGEVPSVETGRRPRMSDAGGQPAMPESLPTPPIPPARRRAVGRRASADDLNEREMTRILNERSLEAARAGRNMFRKGGRVSAKKK